MASPGRCSCWTTAATSASRDAVPAGCAATAGNTAKTAIHRPRRACTMGVSTPMSRSAARSAATGTRYRSQTAGSACRCCPAVRSPGPRSPRAAG
ncbi:hypothetical protein G6F32_015746 [Rhizopus arrhizus]|nr:hypothetical protein G6F32_015746 [Rhizopus arrhizus]